MPRAASNVKRILHPRPLSKPWGEVILLIFFGPWFMAGVYTLFFVKPNPNPYYACTGPGFSDYGCAGGREATIVEIVNAMLTLFLLAICTVIVLRLVNRKQTQKRVTKEVKQGKM
jgi:hypothetical protein